MKKEKISEIISLTDDRFIEEAAVVTKKPKHIFRYVGLAACLAVAVVAGIVISQSDFVTPPPVSTEETTGNESGGGKNTQEITPSPEIVTTPAIEIATEGEMAIMPQWDDLAVPMRYMETKLGDITYSTQNQQIPAENVLSFLGSTEMSGYDIYTDTTYTVNAQIYSIKSVSTDCAVAIKIDDGEEYYVYGNSWYEPDSLGDFINDLDLKNTVVFRKAYIDEYEYFDNGSEHKQRIYADFDDNVIWDMLSDVLDAKNVEYNHPYDRIGIETDLPKLGYKNISFCITPDGYIITNILGTQKCFFIGTEKFKVFDEYLKDNVPFKEYSNVYNLNPDGTIPGKGEEAQSTPGYNPNEDVVPDYYVPGASTAPPYMPDSNIVETTTKIN